MHAPSSGGICEVPFLCIVTYMYKLGGTDNDMNINKTVVVRGSMGLNSESRTESMEVPVKSATVTGS